MASHWIKMNKSLPRDPRVVRIACASSSDRLRTVGGLFSAWCIFDEQTQDGKLEGYTPELLDELVGMPGLARGMEQVGWLTIGDGYLSVPRFEEHNGQSAKRRAKECDRKASARKADNNPLKERQSGRTREEKSTDVLPLLIPLAGEVPESGKDRFLPKGWRTMSRDERKRKRVNANSETMVRIGKFFGRSPDSLWVIAEAVALLELKPPASEIDLLEKYYWLEIDADKDSRRRSLSTLLNNWSSEVDRAKTYFASTAA